ncbi:hypothetical protein [Runella sp.]|uniref:hypothetical protein n=1 Tax=Runella sp. TaxID=1960881 RepID=UPI003D0A9EAE
MLKLCYFILSLGLFALLGCNTETKPRIIPPIFTPEIAVETSDPLLPDSIFTYRPVFGKNEPIRQFPFGPANSPDPNVRLTKVTSNGKLLRSYEYTTQGRLIERTDYYADGLHVYKKHTYNYDTIGIVHITSQLNNEAPNAYVYGIPKTNELSLSRKIGYVSLSDTAFKVLKTTNTVFTDWNQPKGIVETRLGFNAAGALIWEEKNNQWDRLAEYTLYRRDQIGNVILQRYGALSRKWKNQYFTYDTKPNPFRTTGDFLLPEVVDFDATNINNMVTQRVIDSESRRDSITYTYSYRSDGYPDEVKLYRAGQLVGTIGFSYNQ